MGKELNNGKMELCIKGIGNIIKHMDGGNFIMWMVIYLKANGLMIMLMDTVYIHIKMDLNIEAHGKMICNMVEEQKHGWIILSMMVNINSEKNMVGGSISGQIRQNMKGIGETIRYKDMVYINGKTEEYMMEIG